MTIDKKHKDRERKMEKGYTNKYKVTKRQTDINTNGQTYIICRQRNVVKFPNSAFGQAVNV